MNFVDILLPFLFFLPAGVANMAPVLANKVAFLNQWDTPLDFGLKYQDRRLLGDNKRLRGLVTGTILGSLSAVMLHLSFPHLLPFASVNHALFIGALLGFGALVGDAVESFFKRLQGYEPGQSWFPFDQLDYIVGGLLFVMPFISISVSNIVTIFVLYFGLHILSSYLGFLLKLKDKPI